MEQNELDKMYNMLNSSDKEMQNLGMVILRTRNPKLDLARLNYYNWHYDIEDEFVTIVYKQCKNSKERERIIKVVYELKCEAVKKQQFQKAAFLRDIERHGIMQIEKYDQEKKKEV